jgi:hypothetical protein
VPTSGAVQCDHFSAEAGAGVTGLRQRRQSARRRQMWHGGDTSVICGGGELHEKVAHEVKHLMAEPDRKEKRRKAGSPASP